MPRVALVSYDAFQGRGTGLYPPLHLCNLATPLGLAGVEVRVFDYAGPFSQIETLFKEVGDYQPDVVGLTSYTPYLRSFHAHTTALRAHVPDAAMVVGGAHPTVWPEWTLHKMPQFDYAMQGECDRSIVTLIKMIDGSEREEDVPGLVYRRGKDVVANKRDFIADIDELPPVQPEPP